MILWLAERYSQLKELPENIDGIVIDHSDSSKIYYNTHKLPKSVLMIGEVWSYIFIKKYPEIKTFYIDESIVNKRFTEHEALHNTKDIVFGEPDRDFLLQYKDYKCQVTYTAYREYIKIFGLRIPLFWTNQIKTWEWMQKEFGNWFKVCWISIDKNKNDYQELIQWAKDHNKEVWIYIEDKVTVDEAIKTLEDL